MKILKNACVLRQEKIKNISLRIANLLINHRTISSNHKQPKTARAGLLFILYTIIFEKHKPN